MSIFQFFGGHNSDGESSNVCGWKVSIAIQSVNKHITIINDDSKVVRMTLQVVASPMIIILMTLEVSFMLLVESNNSTGIT